MADPLTGRRGRPPTVRSLAAFALTAFALLTLAGLAALLGGSVVLRGAMDTVIRDTRSAALAGELEVAVLMHQRLSNLYVATGEARVDAERRNLALQMRRTVREASEFIGVAEEQELLDRVSVGLDAYMDERLAAEARGLRLSEIVSTAGPALGEVLANLRRLRQMNDMQVAEARSRALRVDMVATWVGLSAAVLLIAGAAAIAWAVGRYVLRPVVALHGAIARFSAGDTEVRAGTGGVQEVDELARMFNDMAANLAQQRKAQLTFLAGVAHDLKSPLSTLKTGMYTLVHESSEDRRARTRVMLDQQVDLLTRMVDDLLDATRIEAGELELRRAEFDLGDLAEEVVRLHAPLAPQHQLSTQCPEQPVKIYADRLRVEQVIRNLVSNAIKFSPEGGPVEVRVEQPGDGAVLVVQDRGIGIAAEDLQAMFLPFRRRRLTDAPGAGLGLSVVRRIVTAHGGSIAVESEPDEGSTFSVTFPRSAAASTEVDPTGCRSSTNG